MPQDKTPSSLPLGALIAEGFMSPRQSMARVLALRPGEGERLLMVGIGIAISMLGFALLGDRAEAPISETGEPVPPGGAALGYIVTVLGGLFQYYLISWIVGLACRATGGTGDIDVDRTLVAWWALISAPLAVLMVVAMQYAESPLGLLTMFVSAIMSFVLLAAYIAEGHGFESTTKVCGAMIGLLMIFGFVMSSLLPVTA